MKSISRRTLLEAATVAGVGLSLRPLVAAGAAGDTIVLSTYGGALDKALQDSYIDPFTKATGTKVEMTSNASLATLKLQAQSGHPQIDAMVVVASDYPVAAEQGLLEPVHYTHQGDMTPSMTKEYGFLYDTYAWGIAYDKAKMASGPQNWVEFWNTKKYPGQRSMYDNLSDGSTLEAALIADGVPVSKLYPIDVDRALKSLDKLGKNNIVWYSTNAQPIQQLTSGATALATAFNGRVELSNKNQGTNLTFVLNQAALGGSYMTVVKGAPHKEAAMELLNAIAANAKGCVAFAEVSHYGCVNKSAYGMMPASLRGSLPGSPQTAQNTFIKDGKWWGANADAVTKRFKEWQQA
ncbi:MAG: extracellular solute-binding protein [Vulcanimicrobiaceae bacterium]